MTEEIKHPKTMWYCNNCKRHVHGQHLQKPWGNGHDVFVLGLILPLQPHKPEDFKPRLKLAAPLPRKVDMRPILANGGFVPFDQGQQGSCTANCGCADRAFMEIKAGTYTKPKSRSFTYARERLNMGTFPDDSGANMSDIGDVFGVYGVCFDSTMPYRDTDCATKPSNIAYTEALNYRCNPNQVDVSVDQIKQVTYEASIDVTAGAVRIGIPVPENFMDAINNGGYVPATPSGSILGGHALLVMGYDDDLKGPDGNVGYYIILNSWGLVGASGYLYIPYVFMTYYGFNTDNKQQHNLGGTPPTTGHLQARVFDTTNGVNLEGATVTYQGLGSQVTGANGIADFGQVTEGSVLNGTASKPGYTTDSHTSTMAGDFTDAFNLPVGSNVTYDVTMRVNQGQGILYLQLHDGTVYSTGGSLVVQVNSGETVMIYSTATTGYVFGSYDGIGQGQPQTFGATITADCSVGVNFLAQSVCPVGNAVAELMNFIPWLFDRQGRFHYLVSE
jgi:hypothetical protein